MNLITFFVGTQLLENDWIIKIGVSPPLFFYITNSLLNTFQGIPWTLQNIYELVTLCYFFLNLFYNILRKTRKQVKSNAFP